MYGDTAENHDRLVRTVGRAPDREWIESYVELAELLISETQLDSDDPRLVMSLPRKGTLPVTVNNRYALVAFRGGPTSTEFILPDDEESTHKYANQSDRSARFDAIYNEEKATRPWLVRFDGDPQAPLEDDFKRLWLSAVRTELDRIDKSPYRRHHQTAVYDMVTDAEYREQVFDDAFE